MRIGIAVIAAAGAASTALATGNTPVPGGGLIISEVVDGDLSGGNPKFVEITNTGTVAYVFPLGGGIVVQSNDSADTVVDVVMTGVTINPGQSYTIASSANNGIAQFNLAYGFGADLFTAAFFGNGDDRYAISDGASLTDIYGTFGSRAALDLATYNYTDSYATRNKDVLVGTGAVYAPSGWFVPGPLALDGPDDATRIALLQANTTPGRHTWIPSPGAAALLGLAGLTGLRRRR